MKYFQLFKYAQIENFLRQQGYSENLVSIVLSKPKNIHKAIGKLINENGDLTEDQLIQKINSLQVNPVQPQVQKQTTQDKLLKIFLDDDMSQLQMNKFFKSIADGYHPFVTKILLNKEIHPHDLTTLQEYIENYENLKQRNVAIDKNINNFNSYATWVNEMLRFSDFDLNAVECVYDPTKLRDVTLDDSMNGYEIWKVTNVQSLKNIGMGTKWCTRGDYKRDGRTASMASEYLQEYGAIYVITKNGKLVAQFTSTVSEVKDTNDVNIKKLPIGLNIDKYIIPKKRRVDLASYKLKNDRTFMLDAVKENGIEVLIYASKELKNDRQFMLDAIKIHFRAFSFASKELKNDRTFILDAVKEVYLILKIVSDNFKIDRTFMLEAVKQNGKALQYASNELKNNPQLVLEAVKQSGTALQHASEQLRNDRKFILEAVNQNGLALQHASEQLRNDKQVALDAVKQNSRALQFASQQLQNDPDILAIVNQKKSIARGWYQRIKYL